MHFWDSSALIPLFVAEPVSQDARALFARDSSIAAAWTTPLECVSALSRRRRERTLSEPDFVKAMAFLRGFAMSWHRVEPSADLLQAAERIILAHPVRSADAIQLASAVVASGSEAAPLKFVSFDARLRNVAIAEGLTVLP